MKFIMSIAVFLAYLPIVIVITVVEFGKLAYVAIAYCFDILYDGIRHRDWYL